MLRAPRRGYTRDAFLKGANRWQVSFFDDRARRGAQGDRAGADLTTATGQVLEAWTGFQVPWTMARGYPGAFGRKVERARTSGSRCRVLFVVPFVTPRRPFRLLHLDLLVLLGFSVSLAFFNDGNIGVSVPARLSRRCVYLLVRMLFAASARGRRPPRRRCGLLVPRRWLAVALVFLLGFRVGAERRRTPT